MPKECVYLNTKFTQTMDTLTVIPKFNITHRFQSEFEKIGEQYTLPLSQKEQEQFEEWAVDLSFKTLDISAENHYQEAIKIFTDLANIAAYYQQHQRQVIPS